MKKKSSMKTYGFILFAILFSKVLGLVRTTMLAGYYSTGIEADAFVIASQIPLVFFDVTLGTAVASAFIPVFNKYLGEEKKDRAFEFANIFISVIALVALTICVFILLFPSAVVFLMASQADAQTTLLATALVRVMSPIVLIAVLAYSYVAVLQSLGEFGRPAIMSALSNLAVILYFIFFNDNFGIYGLATALVIGWGLQVLILLKPLREKGVRFQFMPRLKDEGMKEVVLLTLPVLLSSWAVPINKIVNNNFASAIAGGPATMDYAYQLYFMVAGVFSLALTNLFFPKMAQMHARGEKKENFSLLCTLLTNISMIVTPVMLFFVLFAKDIIGFVYERGAFVAADTVTTGLVLTCYSVGMMGVSWQEILNKYFYSGHNSKTPMKIAIVGIFINIGLSYLLTRHFGLVGIAVASTISVTFIGVTLFFMAKIHAGENIFSFIKDMAKVLVGAMVCTVVLLVGSRLIGGFSGGTMGMNLLKMIVVFGVAVGCYLGVLICLNAGQVKNVVANIKKGR